jgi:hypothetical protein
MKKAQWLAHCCGKVWVVEVGGLGCRLGHCLPAEWLVMSPCPLLRSTLFNMWNYVLGDGPRNKGKCCRELGRQPLCRIAALSGSSPCTVCMSQECRTNVQDGEHNKGRLKTEGDWLCRE